MNKITLTVLGSGTMAITKKRNASGFFLEADGRKVLIDAGLGTVRRMADFGIDYMDIDYVFISHFHTGHFGDAFNLVHSRWVNDNYSGKSNKKLIYLCPEGTEERFKLWRKVCWIEPNESYPVDFLEGERKIKIGNIDVETFPVYHVQWFQSVGFVIRYGRKKIVYTGDIGSKHDFNELLKIVSGADLLITEASYEKPTPNHYTIEQVKRLVAEAKVKKVLVVHVRPQHENTVTRFVKKEKNFILAEDGMKIRF